MVHKGQGLALCFKPRQHSFRVHPGFDELEGDLAANRLGLLSYPHRPHASFADLFEELVTAGHDNADPLAGRIMDRGSRLDRWVLLPLGMEVRSQLGIAL